jgi:hypothetical protein
MRQAVPLHVLVKRIAEGVSAEETKFFQKETGWSAGQEWRESLDTAKSSDDRQGSYDSLLVCGGSTPKN